MRATGMWMLALWTASFGIASAQSLFDDAPVEGAWYDPAAPGQGLTIDALPDGRLFVGWYTHAADGSGQQRWYTATMTLHGATASGALQRTSGGALASGTPAPQTTEAGSLAIDFADCRTATVTYSLRDGDRTAAGTFVAVPARELVAGAPACTVTAKLRWPHIDPTLDDAAYAQRAADVFIPNNYGLHQGGVAERPGDVYMHDGIDLAAPNGATIYALEAGTVRSVTTAGTNSGMTVTVESAAMPSHGWAYVHIVPSVAVGAAVARGQPLGTVQFLGLEHLHLSRVRKPAGVPDWSFERLLTINPIGWFEPVDTEPPLFRQRLLFQRDGADTVFAADAPISGKVDIVAGIRDPGPQARRMFGNSLLGDRHGVQWIDYTIEGQGTLLHRRAFDFNVLEIGRLDGSPWSMTPYAQVVYQPILLVQIDSDADRLFNHYKLTHGTAGTSVLLTDAQQAWDTAARHADGTRAFPDGEYRITVRAADAAGNLSTFVDTVEVRND